MYHLVHKIPHKANYVAAVERERELQNEWKGRTPYENKQKVAENQEI